MTGNFARREGVSQMIQVTKDLRPAYLFDYRGRIHVIRLEYNWHARLGYGTWNLNSSLVCYLHKCEVRELVNGMQKIPKAVINPLDYIGFHLLFADKNKERLARMESLTEEGNKSVGVGGLHTRFDLPKDIIKIRIALAYYSKWCKEVMRPKGDQARPLFGLPFRHPDCLKVICEESYPLMATVSESIGTISEQTQSMVNGSLTAKPFEVISECLSADGCTAYFSTIANGVWRYDL